MELGGGTQQKNCEEAERCSWTRPLNLTTAESELKLALDAAAWLQPLGTV